MSERSRENIGQASPAWQKAARRFGTLWCDFMHDSPMWPFRGEYECRTCGRRYPVPWAGDRFLPDSGKLIATEPARLRRAGIPSLRSASLLLIIALSFLLASPVQAANEPVVDSTGGAAAAFARYIVGLERESPWGLETVEIDASLPKLNKQGRLSAVRRLLRGRPEYQVLEVAGDETVRQQLIVRYLSAQVRAAAIPASSVAITLANYKFRYTGAVQTGGTTAYVFLITPRQKREGLIKGALWLDGETGAAVRQSGYLVEKPSIFVKRIDVTRETALRDGMAELRVTHLSVETRLVGRAQLVIHERPCPTPDDGPAPNIAER